MVGLRRGSFRNFDLIGRDGLNLVDYWADGPSTFLGIHSQGFPNMFVLVGPQAPAIITNVTQVIEQQVLHIVEIVKEMQAKGHAVVECTQEAEANWVEHCVRSQPRPGLLPLSSARFGLRAQNALYPNSVWSNCNSWYNKRAHGKADGTIEGYTGSFKTYMDEGIMAIGLDGLQFS